jgi:hypothetical protein
MFAAEEMVEKLWKVFVDIFTVKDANKHENIVREHDADPIVPDANSIVIAAAFQLFQI